MIPSQILALILGVTLAHHDWRDLCRCPCHVGGAPIKHLHEPYLLPDGKTWCEPQCCFPCHDCGARLNWWGMLKQDARDGTDYVGPPKPPPKPRKPPIDDIIPAGD